MPFFIRKAISVGPFRFNLSKSGVGVSTGIKGLRLSIGPRGNYIFAGRHGLYYRATLPKFSGQGPVGQPSPVSPVVPFETAYAPAFDGLTEIASGSVLQMTDSSSAGLLKELNEKHAKAWIWPLPFLATIIAVAGLVVAQFSPAWTVCIGLIGGAGTIVALQYDKLRKTVVLFYHLDDDMLKAYQALHIAFDRLGNCGGKWHIEAKGGTDRWKYNAGADTLVRRTPVRFHNEMPSWLKTNISVPVIPLRNKKFYFFPDRLLVVESGQVGAVGFGAMKLTITDSKFFEDGPVPPDAQVVGTTWRYVNKKGGPDRRFANNYEIPIVIYYDLSIEDKSGFGLNEQLSFSQLPALKEFGFSLVELSKYPKDAEQSVETPRAPDAIKFLCPACRQPIEAEPDMAGTQATCPTCKNKLEVPITSQSE
jgi:hypothetical protein